MIIKVNDLACSQTSKLYFGRSGGKGQICLYFWFFVITTKLLNDFALKILTLRSILNISFYSINGLGFEFLICQKHTLKGKTFKKNFFKAKIQNFL